MVGAVLVQDNVQGKFQCPGHILDIVPDNARDMKHLSLDSAHKIELLDVRISDISRQEFLQPAKLNKKLGSRGLAG